MDYTYIHWFFYRTNDYWIENLITLLSMLPNVYQWKILTDRQNGNHLLWVGALTYTQLLKPDNGKRISSFPFSFISSNSNDLPICLSVWLWILPRRAGKFYLKLETITEYVMKRHTFLKLFPNMFNMLVKIC